MAESALRARNAGSIPTALLRRLCDNRMGGELSELSTLGSRPAALYPESEPTLALNLEVGGEALALFPAAMMVGKITTPRSRLVEETVSAADANRRFSLLPRGVREGRSYVVTSHGKPVARLIPAGKHDDVVTSARATLLSRLEKQLVMNAGRWTRDELYEDDR